MTIGILLAGGNSTRFKEDKALYFDPRFQKSWGQLQVEKLVVLCDNVYVVANQKNVESLKNKLAMYTNVKIILDNPSYFNEGPLSALYAVSKKTKKNDYLLLGIDYPDVDISDLKKLLSKKNVYAIDGSLSPHYTLSHLSFPLQRLEEFLKTGNRRLRDFLKTIGATELQITEEILFNYNRLKEPLKKEGPEAK